MKALIQMLAANRNCVYGSAFLLLWLGCIIQYYPDVATVVCWANAFLLLIAYLASFVRTDR